MLEQNKKIINVTSYSENPDIAKLSNFSHSPFMLDEVTYASVETFVQCLKIPTAEVEEEYLMLYNSPAKRIGDSVRTLIEEAYEGDDPVGYVTNYQGIQIPYQSEEHYALIQRAILAKFIQNPDLARALIKTEGFRLIHDLGKPEDPLTALSGERFGRMLMWVRDYLQKIEIELE